MVNLVRAGVGMHPLILPLDPPLLLSNITFLIFAVLVV